MHGTVGQSPANSLTLHALEELSNIGNQDCGGGSHNIPALRHGTLHLASCLLQGLDNDTWLPKTVIQPAVHFA